MTSIGAPQAAETFVGPRGDPRPRFRRAVADATSGRLVEGRAGDQRHHGRRGPAAPPVPRHPRPDRRWPRPRAVDPLPAARRTGPGRPSTAGPPTCPPRSRPTSPCAWPATRRRRPHARGRGSSSATRGGIEATRVFTRIWLALFGLWPWDDLPALPPEIILLPALGPAQHLRLRLLGPPDGRAPSPWSWPTGRCGRCRSASTSCAAVRAPAPAPAGAAAWAGCFTLLDRVLHRYERLARSRRVRAAALARAERWILAPPGGRRLLGRHPAAVGVLDHGPAPAGLPARPPGHARRPGRPRRLHHRRRTTAAGSRPASRRCGTPPWPWSPWPTPASVADDPALVRGRRLAARRGGPGPAATGPCAGRAWPPGGWAFEFANDNYPDIDDTAEVVLALRRAGRRRRSDRRRGRPAGRGLDRSACSAATAAGGPSTSTTPRTLCRRPPLLRLRRGHRPAERRRHRPRGRDARPSSARRQLGRRARRRLAAAAAQEADGSWFGRWGANHVYGTGARRARPRRRRRGAARPADPPGRGAGSRPPERRRRLGRGPPLLPTTRLAGPGRRRRRPRRRGPCSPCWRPASATAPAIGAGRGLAGRDPAPTDGTWDEP